MTLWFETIRYMLSYIREREASLDSLRWKLGFKHYIKNEMSLIAPALPYLLRKCFWPKTWKMNYKETWKMSRIYLTVILIITSTMSCSWFNCSLSTNLKYCSLKPLMPIFIVRQWLQQFFLVSIIDNYLQVCQCFNFHAP